MYPRFTSMVILGVSWIVFALLRIGRRKRTLPPGPPTIPVLGNIQLLPFKFPYLRFTEWAKEYGGIISLKVANETIIVISDMRIVKELLDDRSSETSSRPFSYALDVVSGGNYFPLAASDSYIWKNGRKAIQPLLSSQAVLAHLPVTDTETIQLLYDILHGPDDFWSHVTRSTFSFISSVVFGKSAPKHDSPEPTLFLEYMRHFMKAVSPEAAPVDLIPILKYVPERWAPWKQLWRETRKLQRSLFFSLLEHTEQRITSGNRSNNFIENILDRQSELGLNREMIAYIGGVLIDAGTETMSSIIQSLVLCLMKSPASLRKVQDEIDNVVSNKRLPDLSDISDLPYMQAIIKETYRMRPAVPTGVPHAAINDCKYLGYTIPKGAPILTNIWGIMHDPDLFERPNEFWPERYLLTPDGTKPGLEKDYTIRSSLPFGSGKHLCPGMYLANTNVNLVVMRLLWAFNFAPVDGPALQSKEWNIADEYTDGLSLSPKRFKCKITPRGKEREEVIEDCYKRFTCID